MTTGGAASGGAATGGAAGAAAVMCTGTAAACPSFDGMQSACSAQSGCLIDGFCAAKTLGAGGGANVGAGGAANISCQTTHRAQASCNADANCQWRWPCQAKFPTTDCSSLGNEINCAKAAGCLWNGVNNTCIQNVFNECDSAAANETACANLTSGKCQWTPTDIGCNGTAAPCGFISVASCTSQSGCSVQ